MEYAENSRMTDGTTTLISQLTKKFDKDPKEAKIYELCKQVENLHLIMKQPKKCPKQAEPMY